MHTPRNFFAIIHVCHACFAVIEIYTPLQPEDEERGNSVKIKITSITPVLRAFLDFFPGIISFQHVPHFGVGRSQIEWKLKVKTGISVFP